MLTIYYTANLRGNLELLPRLYTFLRQLRQGGALPAPAAGRDLLLDLGHACAPDVWHCGATGGRSMLIVLDAMGYHAACVTLASALRDRMRDNRLGLALVDDDHPWQQDDILITSNFGSGAPQTPACRLHVALAPAVETRLVRQRLSLAAVKGGQVGVAQVGDDLTLLRRAVHDLPAGTPPDPTITATVDFVLAEARQLQRTSGGTP